MAQDMHASLRAIVEANRLELGRVKARQLHACAGMLSFLLAHTEGEEEAQVTAEMLNVLMEGLRIEAGQVEEILFATMMDWQQARRQG